jgi:hypothetical protein
MKSLGTFYLKKFIGRIVHRKNWFSCPADTVLATLAGGEFSSVAPRTAQPSKQAYSSLSESTYRYRGLNAMITYRYRGLSAMTPSSGLSMTSPPPPKKTVRSWESRGCGDLLFWFGFWMSTLQEFPGPARLLPRPYPQLLGCDWLLQ